MTLPLWGQLQKSQDDDESIEQAIAKLVQTHTIDPTSHLGTNESLSSHKHENVIDHPAGSIVGDKLSFNLYQEYMADLGSHNWVADFGSYNVNNATTVAVYMNAQSYFMGYCITNHLGSYYYPDDDLMYQFQLSLNGHQSSDGTLYISWSEDEATNATRMSIEKSGTSFYWRLYKNGTVVAQYNLGVGNYWKKYIRIYFDSVNETIRLFIGTTEAVSYTTPDWKDWIFSDINVEISRSTNTNLYFRIYAWKMLYSRDTDL